jgi:hypothetical protein
MTRRTDGTTHNAVAVAAAPMVRTHDRTTPEYASSSQGPEGRMVNAVQQK